MAWFHNGRKYWKHNGKTYSRPLRITNKRRFFWYSSRGWSQTDYFKYLEVKRRNPRAVKTNLAYENETIEYFDNEMYKDGEFSENFWNSETNEFDFSKKDENKRKSENISSCIKKDMKNI